MGLGLVDARGIGACWQRGVGLVCTCWRGHTGYGIFWRAGPGSFGSVYWRLLAQEQEEGEAEEQKANEIILKITYLKINLTYY